VPKWDRIIDRTSVQCYFPRWIPKLDRKWDGFLCRLIAQSPPVFSLFFPLTVRSPFAKIFSTIE
jgi:hypothetical protein